MLRRIHEMFFFLFIIWTSVGSCLSNIYTVQCADEDGNDVDWVVLYKIPKLKNENHYIQEGIAYLYIISKTLSEGWTLSSLSVDSNQSIPGRIISQMLHPLDTSENKI